MFHTASSSNEVSHDEPESSSGVAGLGGKGEEAAPKPKQSKEELSKLRKDAGTKQIKDLDRLIARITEPMSKCEIYRIGEANGHGSEYLLRKNWSPIEARLVKNKKHYQPKPTQ